MLSAAGSNDTNTLESVNKPLVKHDYPYQNYCRNQPFFCRCHLASSTKEPSTFTSVNFNSTVKSKVMKTTKIIYWTSTVLIFLMEGVMPALTSNSDVAKQGISHLGYPDYFRILLTVFKILGALGLLLPFVRGRVKEWVYAGFAFDFIFAAASHTAVDGFGRDAIFALVVFAVLIVSYLMYHKLQKAPVSEKSNSKTYMGSPVAGI